MADRHRCFEIDVDGTPVRVHGDPHMSAESQEALAEIVRVVQHMTPEQIAEADRRSRLRRVT